MSNRAEHESSTRVHNHAYQMISYQSATRSQSNSARIKAGTGRFATVTPTREPASTIGSCCNHPVQSIQTRSLSSFAMDRRKRHSRFRQYLPTMKSIPLGQSRRTRSTAPIRIWYFPQDISQSRIFGRQSTSSACVPIGHLTAADRLFPSSDQSRLHLSPILDRPFANRLIENSIIGNQLHDRYVNEGSSTGRLRIPDAIALINREDSKSADYRLSEMNHVTERDRVFTQRLLRSYVRRIVKFWDDRCREEGLERRKDWPSVAFIIIVNRRAILFVYQSSNSLLFVVDTHSHPGRIARGLLVAASKVIDAPVLLSKIFRRIFPVRKRAFSDGKDSLISASNENE